MGRSNLPENLVVGEADCAVFLDDPESSRANEFGRVRGAADDMRIQQLLQILLVFLNYSFQNVNSETH